MNTSVPNPSERILNVRIDEYTLAADLADGRAIIVPLVWFPRLAESTEEARQSWQIAGPRYGIHWPDMDEDVSSAGMLRGAPAGAKRSGAA
jgi:hypothetical protein